MAGMQLEEFEKLLCSGIRQFGLSVDDCAVERLYTYFQELKRWSRKSNLIARETGDGVIVEKHFVDSLALLTVLDDTADYLLDIGSGAGFPGLPCKIVRPALKVDLLEPRLKRVSFLRHITRVCGLIGVDVLPVRLEKGNELLKEAEYTCVTGRAVTDIAQFLTMCSRFRKNGTRVICMKGPKFKQELEEAAGRIDGWKLIAQKEYRLLFSSSSRALLVFEGLDNN